MRIFCIHFFFWTLLSPPTDGCFLWKKEFVLAEWADSGQRWWWDQYIGKMLFSFLHLLPWRKAERHDSQPTHPTQARPPVLNLIEIALYFANVNTTISGNSFQRTDTSLIIRSELSACEDLTFEKYSVPNMNEFGFKVPLLIDTFRQRIIAGWVMPLLPLQKKNKSSSTEVAF